ncbi:MAG: ribonuclease III [Geminicoccaceae bacterium]|nr:MAG: ribonuclease III [Geminicoccaceae bacterium]
MLKTPLEPLQQRLGYRFRDGSLLRRALVHRSAGERRQGDNERLEFLGDRVLGLVVADLLCRRFAHEPEGGLSKRHAALVRRETLAEVAKTWRIADDMVMAAGEVASGGRANPALLADAVEAIIGAVYLDGGFEAARQLVERDWEPRLSGLAEAPRDPKTALQEWSQAQGLGLPVYEEIGRSGPAHAPSFKVAVRVARFPAQEAEAGSKRQAEQKAAAALLAKLEGQKG